jgi:carboxylesterase
LDPALPTDRPAAAPPAGGAAELQALSPWIATRLRRRRRYLQVCLGLIGCGLLSLALGTFLARRHGLATLERELARWPLDAAQPVRPGSEARTWERPEASAAVLLVHGWCSSPADFATLPEELHARGLHVRAMRLPGHGTDPRDFARTGLDQWRAAVRAEFEGLASRFPTVHAVGFSMGGALLTELAAERELGRLALLAPYFGVPYPQPLGLDLGRLLPLIEKLVPYVDSGPGVRSLACREFEDRVLKYRAIPLAAVIEVHRLGRAVNDPALLARVTEPLLVVAAPQDPVASAERAFAALRRTASVERREVRAEHSQHILAWDCDRELVRAAVVQFLTAE